jgi:hypothetical protein
MGEAVLNSLLEVIKLFGAPAFAAIFGAAAATFWFFHWLNENARGRVKDALSECIKRRMGYPTATSDAFKGLFDFVYTQSLLTWRAFWRSFLVSVITLISLVSLIYIFAPSWSKETDNDFWEYIALALSSSIIIACNYAALFL